MKIAVAVHGRFHGFDLARELAHLGHDVTLFGNYPKSAMRRFGLPGDKTHSLLVHGLSSRIANKLLPASTAGWRERHWNSWFGTWAAKAIAKEHWDTVIAFSGIALPIFAAIDGQRTLKVLQRGSTHIAVQRELLDAESLRSGVAGDRPSDWIVQRESAEYAAADLIQVLSTFAKRTFVDQGIADEKIGLIRQGADESHFRVSQPLALARQRRIQTGEPLHILFVGPFTFRKGALDLVAVARQLSNGNFKFRVVGPQPAETAALRNEAGSAIEFVPTVPRDQLPSHYAWGDIFLFPTIEDGGAVVLFQALGSGLPILASTNCAAPDIVCEGVNGFVIPIRDPLAIAQRLQWCNENRSSLAAMTNQVAMSQESLTWGDMGRQAQENIQRAWLRRFGNDAGSVATSDSIRSKSARQF